MSLAYYNENDPKAAAWLEELIKGGHIASGVVDTRSIEDVTPEDVRGFTQCHFFAGIGGWSYALRLAGWPDERPVWTGSCPCQPFSAAGKGGGIADERHLWPALFHLVQQLSPAVLFGEQVASKAGLAWLDIVRTDLEDTHYAVGAADLCAAGVGAPHIRQRLYWVGHASGGGGSGRHAGTVLGAEGGASGRLRSQFDESELASADGGMADSSGNERGPRRPSETNEGAQQPAGRRYACGLADDDGAGRRERQRDGAPLGYWAPTTASSRLGDDDDAGLEGRSLSASRRTDERTAWTPSDVVWCRDGKWRPVEPGTFPLAHGVPGRVGLLRGYGNAIVPQVAAAFIEAYLE